MYLREISNVLAIACIFRKENLINQARRKKLSVNLNDLCTLVIATSLLVKVGNSVWGGEGNWQSMIPSFTVHDGIVAGPC